MEPDIPIRFHKRPMPIPILSHSNPFQAPIPLPVGQFLYYPSIYA